MITFLGLTFSITMVVLQLTSSQYSPRVLRSFLRDRQSQWTLGVFVATFVYVVLVLREVRGTAGDIEQFVPGPAITFAFVLLLLSIGAFVAYINHMAQSIRPERILDSVAAETREAPRAMARTRRRPPGHRARGIERIGSQRIDASPRRRTGSCSPSTSMDSSDLGQHHDIHISLIPRIGDFVPAGAVAVRASHRATGR